MKVWVYRNLNKGGFSLMANNKVQGHSDFVLLKDVELRVREGGNRRARETGQRNVHAYCIGEVLSVEEGEYELPRKMIEVTYNPFADLSFIIKTSKRPIFEARIAVLMDDKLWVVI